MDEHSLAERLISYDTSDPEGVRRAAEFVKGWLESRDLKVTAHTHNDLPVLVTEVGPVDGPCVVLHGHIDVVPAHEGQFEPRIDGDRLIGRGAYDMKGALGAMMCTVRDAAEQDRVRVRFMCVPDEEAEDVESRSTDALVAMGLAGSFAITGEPTELLIGVQAKGVLALRLALAGTAAHGSRPWLGDNAILKAVDAYRRIETLPFSRESSELFDRPSINLARITGGDAFNKVPDRCEMVVDIRYLPEQDPQTILEQIRAIGDVEVVRSFTRAPAMVSRRNPYVLALRDAVSRSIDGEALSIGRDGASDAISFLEAGVPAVEFGPIGGGHHGPEEWVSLSSLTRYRQALGDFVRELPVWLSREDPPDLRALEGGLA
jgi:succinyl-diaminopimelate desuccinylase